MHSTVFKIFQQWENFGIFGVFQANQRNTRTKTSKINDKPGKFNLERLYFKINQISFINMYPHTQMFRLVWPNQVQLAEQVGKICGQGSSVFQTKILKWAFSQNNRMLADNRGVQQCWLHWGQTLITLLTVSIASYSVFTVVFQFSGKALIPSLSLWIYFDL